MKRLLLGRPLATARLAHERLGKPTALAVFSSDNMSSVAYATEEILRVLIPAVGIAAFSLVHGFRRRRELFVIYAYVYGLIAVDIVVVADFLHDEIVVAAYVMLSTVAVIVALFVTHMRLRRAEA